MLPLSMNDASYTDSLTVLCYCLYHFHLFHSFQLGSKCIGLPCVRHNLLQLCKTWLPTCSSGCMVYIYIYITVKNTSVTLTTFLGCLSCISVTKNCYQIGFLNVHRGAFSLVTLLSSEDLFGYIPSISSHSYANKELSRSRCIRSKK